MKQIKENYIQMLPSNFTTGGISSSINIFTEHHCKHKGKIKL